MAGASDTEPAMSWVELSVEADAESVESVAELLSRFGYNQGVVIQEPYVQDPDGDHLAIDPTRPVAVSTYLPRDERLDETLRRIDEGLWHLRQIGTIGEPIISERPEEDWANAWKEHFQVTRIGRRFVVRPSWREYAPRQDDIVIDLDPGMAFGTGLHPSTELCLHWLEELPLAGTRLLDAGAGSGILSIAALKLGAASVDAIEIDPIAAKALRHNLELNGLVDRVEVRVGDAGSLASGAGKVYDLILANMISSVLIHVSDGLARVARPGTQLVLSGVIEAHEAEVIAAYQRLGFSVEGRRAAKDWVSLLFTRLLTD